MDAPLLAIENLRTYFYSRARRALIRSVDGVSLHVAPGETLGIVGESGSGKSVTALSAAGLVSAAPGVIGGRIELRSRQARRNLLDGLERYVRVKERDGRIMAVEKDDRGWRRRAETLMKGVRGKEIAMIFQNPRSALNPYSTIGAQLKIETGITTLLISHDISVIQRLADRIAVMYGGTVVETGRAAEVLAPQAQLRHPYTAALLASVPSAEAIRRKSYLQAIEGEVLDTIDVPRGCRFYGRCNRVTEAIRENCASLEPPLGEVAPGHKVRCWLYPASGKA